MKTSPSQVRILVASDSVVDAQQIRRQIEPHFESIILSTVPARAIEDFEEARPEVLVLAFESLEKAQTYYLGLYRLGKTSQRQAHRTVILCHKNEVQAVFDLCRKDYFDDYVLYWPHTFDGPRLAMSIWVACREVITLQSEPPGRAELFAHAKQAGKLGDLLAQDISDVQEHEAAMRSELAESEKEIAGSIGEFSRRLAESASANPLDPYEAGVLKREVDALKQRQVANARRADASKRESMTAWTERLKGRVEPALADTKLLADKVRRIRPIVMVVDDDEFARQLVAKALDPEAWETRFAEDGDAALVLLHRTQPDLILMDIKLPGLDGVSLTQRLKAEPHLAHVPILMMTGDSRRETLVRSMEAGAAGFVVKPFTRVSLTAKLEKFFPR